MTNKNYKSVAEMTQEEKETFFFNYTWKLISKNIAENYVFQNKSSFTLTCELYNKDNVLTVLSIMVNKGLIDGYTTEFEAKTSKSGKLYAGLKSVSVTGVNPEANGKKYFKNFEIALTQKAKLETMVIPMRELMEAKYQDKIEEEKKNGIDPFEQHIVELQADAKIEQVSAEDRVVLDVDLDYIEQEDVIEPVERTAKRKMVVKKK